MSKSKTKKQQKKRVDTVLSILQEIQDTLHQASHLVVGLPTLGDRGTLWLSNDSIDAWNVRTYDQQSDSYIDPRGYYNEPKIRQPYHLRKWREGDLPKVECWPIRVRDFYAAVDEKLKPLRSKLIELDYQFPDRWKLKPIKFSNYIDSDEAADAWDELRVLIQTAEVISQKRQNDIIQKKMIQSWDDNNSVYINASEAIIRFANSKISLSEISKKMKKSGEVRYMQKGQRCKVHCSDFKKYIRLHHREIITNPEEAATLKEAADEYVADIEARKKEAHKSKRNNK